MTTEAEYIVQMFDDDEHGFASRQEQNLEVVCSARCSHVEDKFGKRKFNFSDGSSIVIVGGSGFLGYGVCFCEGQNGHHPDCSEFRLPPFTIEINGSVQRSMGFAGSRHQARRQARFLLHSEPEASHAYVLDESGERRDTYQRIPLPDGHYRVEKMNVG